MSDPPENRNNGSNGILSELRRLHGWFFFTLKVTFHNFILRPSLLAGYTRRVMSTNICANCQHVLKGLSHEIDFKNVDENGHILALLRAAAGFEFFGGSSDF